MPLLSAITTCKGRLDHLKLSLPTLVALPDCEVVLVDYDCPEGAGDWARAHYPSVRVVQVADRPFFNIAEARNRGAAAASADWLLLIDADVLVEPGLAAGVRPLLRPGVFLRPDVPATELVGTVIVARADLAAIGGYDEVFEGWGSEDLDVMARLELAGLRATEFPGRLMNGIAHGDDFRGRYHAIADPAANTVINAVYRQVKMDLMRQGAAFEATARRAVYDQIRRAAMAPEGLNSIEVAFRERAMAGRLVTTSLRYVVRRPG